MSRSPSISPLIRGRPGRTVRRPLFPRGVGKRTAFSGFHRVAVPIRMVPVADGDAIFIAE